MKKIMGLFLIVFFCFASVNPAYAGDVGDKFKKGLMTFLKSPKQMCTNISEEMGKAEFKPFGAVGGMFKGLVYFGKDMVTGAVEMLTANSEFMREE